MSTDIALQIASQLLMWWLTVAMPIWGVWTLKRMVMD